MPSVPSIFFAPGIGFPSRRQHGDLQTWLMSYKAATIPARRPTNPPIPTPTVCAAFLVIWEALPDGAAVVIVLLPPAGLEVVAGALDLAVSEPVVAAAMLEPETTEAADEADEAGVEAALDAPVVV